MKTNSASDGVTACGGSLAGRGVCYARESSGIAWQDSQIEVEPMYTQEQFDVVLT